MAPSTNLSGPSPSTLPSSTRDANRPGPSCLSRASEYVSHHLAPSVTAAWSATPKAQGHDHPAMNLDQPLFERPWPENPHQQILLPNKTSAAIAERTDGASSHAYDCLRGLLHSHRALIDIVRRSGAVDVMIPYELPDVSHSRSWESAPRAADRRRN